MDTFLPYLIVCPMVFMAGLIDAVAGGGGLISLPAYMIAGKIAIENQGRVIEHKV